ncbi:MAG TPA: alpha-L-glutamate ligase [Acidobacteria bacterium]|nr:alpha-L-glutamate ligase [Acidobacteriota bacterium]HCE03321.1 alpha-L-glutamate ligase [Acidobacteriota bacterium]
MPRIYVLHENDEWVTPLRDAFRARGLPFIEWFLATGIVDLDTMPPDGVFYNRMSASSHTRGHRYGPEYAAAVLSWLERHGRRILNGPLALTLEVSKVAQYAALEAGGVRTPRTIAAVGRDEIIRAARGLPLPFITKHNRAGKGLGVRLFRDYDALVRYVESNAFEPSIDGITLLQEYIDAPEPCITRVEFVGGRFLYAVRVDTSQGFELCPADACRVSADNDDFCPAGDAADSLFRILEGFEHPLVERYATVLAANDIHIAGVEFIDDRDGVSYTYDINTNTNYNSEAEALAGCSGMGAIAEYLGRELEKVRPS